MARASTPLGYARVEYARARGFKSWAAYHRAHPGDPGPSRNMRRAPRTSVFTMILPETVKANNRAAGAKKAARKKRGKAKMRKAMALRSNPAFMAEYRVRQPVAKRVRRRTLREQGSKYYAWKDYERTLRDPYFHERKHH